MKRIKGNPNTKTAKAVFPDKRRVRKKQSKILFTLLEEPKLLFGNQCKHDDPKKGLTDFGPFSLNTALHPAQVKVGFIGTGETIEMARQWMVVCMGPIPGKKNTKLYRLFQQFPGFNENTPFHSEFVFHVLWNNQVTRHELDSIVRTLDKRKRFDKAVELFAGKIQTVAQLDAGPDVIVVALPKEIENYCKTVGKELGNKKVKLTPMERKLQKRILYYRKIGQMTLFDMLSDIEERGKDLVYKNFRRSLKAKVMKWNVPTQIILESSLTNGRGKQDEATRAWNLCTAMYYKAGGIPWNLSIEKGTCFVGVSFYQHITETSFTTHSSLAQVFTDRGDFLVLRGEKFHWDPKQGRSPHLTAESAKGLIQLVLQKYKEWTGNLPRRVVVHKTSKYLPDELKGFLEGLQNVSEYDLVALYSTGVRFFREGLYPPLRNTYCSIGDEAHFIYTIGYIPYLATYPRGYVPEPLQIVQHIGDSTKKKICQEILALSKMNWNCSEYANKMPITLSFAQKVGEILSYIPDFEEPNPSYKFYM